MMTRDNGAVAPAATSTRSMTMMTIHLTETVIVAEDGGRVTAWGWGPTEAEARAMNDDAPDCPACPATPRLIEMLEATDEETPDLTANPWASEIDLRPWWTAAG